MGATDKLNELRRRADELRPWARYDKTWPEEAEKAKRELAALQPQIEAEEERLASFKPGLEMEARLATEAAAVLSANQRMADASEAAARSSAEAAQASRSSARWTLVAALVAAGAVAIQAWQATTARPPPAAVDGGKKLGG